VNDGLLFAAGLPLALVWLRKSPSEADIADGVIRPTEYRLK
jgi:hypothetical protein